MADPFNFSTLLKHAPKYMGMDSLKEALLSEDSVNQNEIQHGRDSTPMCDVSMVDQELTDDFNDANSPNPDENLTDNILDDEMTTHTEPDLEIPKEQVNTDSAPIWRESSDRQSHPLHTVIAPTQAGAHQALAPYGPLYSYSHHQPHLYSAYSEDLRMPIPPPWHRNLQYTFSTYLQLAFNIGMMALVGWLLLIMKNDVSKKIAERRASLIRDAHWCQEQFIMNNCRSGRAAPHLIENKKCLELEHCMDMDPDNIRWLSMYASLIAEIMNEFILPLQMRTMVFLLTGLSLVVLVVGANYWFGFWRAKSYFHRSMDAMDDRVQRSVQQLHSQEQLRNQEQRSLEYH